MDSNDPIHAVQNQSTSLQDYDAFTSDKVLVNAVTHEGAEWASDQLAEAGRLFASARVLRLAALANEHPPQLHTHDRQGRRIDEVKFHPAWHELLEMSVSRGSVAQPWTDDRAGAQVARAALFFLHAQAETGTQCPIAMSFGAVPVLRQFTDALPQIGEQWLPKLLSAEYDARFLPVAEKRGVLLGMGMTERQGGSDVRGNITFAKPVAARGSGQPYSISGHKWFFSAPMCDAFLVLAQTDGGISCLLVPRFRDDGSLNALRLQRLKDKLGNRSNASSEVEFHDADGYLLGDEGRGVATIIEMATYTRLDCVLATAGMQRRALAVAIHHASQREAFGAKLIDKPLMSAVLADMAIESEASTRLAMYLAHCFDNGAQDTDRHIGRLLTPAAKFHVCKRGPQFAAEAMEVLGGNGYIEELDLARIYREMPLLSIWEGSGNVMCLDVLRGVTRDHEAVAALRQRFDESRGEHAALDAHTDTLACMLKDPAEADGRRIAHGITLAVQAGLLIRQASTEVADAFCATRLSGAGHWGHSFGTLPAGIDTAAIVRRAMPSS